MTIEKQLKKYVLNRYNSILNFSKKIKLPEPTCRSFFEKKIENSNVKTLVKVCKNLDISIDLLLAGQIGKLSLTQIDLRDDEKKILKKYNILNEIGKNRLIEISDEMTNLQKYIKNDIEHDLANHTKWQNH